MKAKCVKRERELCRSWSICAMLFKPNDFVQCLDFQEEEGILWTSWLKQDKLGKNRFSVDSCRSNLTNSWQLVSVADRDRRLGNSELIFSEQMVSTVLCKSNANDNRRISRISRYIGDI